MIKLQVNPRSIAEQSGLKVGDVIQDINGMTTAQMKHQEAQQTIINAGNRISLNINRSVMCNVRQVFLPRIILRWLYHRHLLLYAYGLYRAIWRAQPQKYQMAPHHMPRATSTENTTPKTQSKTTNPNPQTTINEKKLRTKSKE